MVLQYLDSITKPDYAMEKRYLRENWLPEGIGYISVSVEIP